MTADRTGTRWLSAVAMLLAGSLLHAAEPDYEPSAGIDALTRLEVDLAANEDDPSAIESLLVEAVALKEQGLACSETAAPRVAALQSELEILGEPDPNEEIDIWEQRQAISEVLSKASARKSNCELLAARAGQFEDTAERALERISSQRMWSRGPSLLSGIGAALTALKRAPDEAMGPAWQSRFELGRATMLGIGAVLAIVAIGLGLHARSRFYEWAVEEGLKDGPPKLRFLFPRPVADNAPVLLAGLILSAYVYIAALTPTLSLFMLRLAIGLFLFGLGTVFIRWSTNTLSPAATVKGLAPEHTETLRTRMRTILLLLITGFVTLGPGWLGNAPSPSLLFLHTLLSLLLAASLAWLILLARRVAGLRRRYRLVRFAAVVTLVVSASAGLIGFHNFANYLLLGVLKSLLAAFFLWLLLWLTSSVIEIIARGGTPRTYRLRAALGLSPTRAESGLGMYNLAVDLVLWLGFLYLVAVSWDATGKLPDEVADFLIDGFPIGTVQVIPIHLIYGLLAFLAILIITGWIKRSIQRRYIQRTQMDRGARDALITITGYVGFTVALLVGLNFTGISFAGLAVIGAALGVGIGFGLQNIVNNFVSGLILLFERPIKSGDFVTVSGIEGTVKQISIRSTEIETLDRQNVIVPNSELVSQQVTNWVLHDPHGRLQIFVGVAYGSDVELVRTTLLKVALNHPQVLNDGISSPKPKVLFREFGDSALIFELRIWIRQIRRRFDVTSEINFDIDRAFREAGIEIPFPQRDLHIKSWSDSARPPGPATGKKGDA